MGMGFLVQVGDAVDMRPSLAALIFAEGLAKASANMICSAYGTELALLVVLLYCVLGNRKIGNQTLPIALFVSFSTFT